jgi:hypothetical protein
VQLPTPGPSDHLAPFRARTNVSVQGGWGACKLQSEDFAS